MAATYVVSCVVSHPPAAGAGSVGLLIRSYCPHHLPHVIFGGLTVQELDSPGLWTNYCDECEVH